MNFHQLLRPFILFFACFIFFTVSAQNVERIYQPYIQTAQLFMSGSQQALPVYNLISGGQLELEFDDMEGSVKSYYYSFVLCDYNWNQLDLSPFDYTKGFTQNRITTYRYSSIALTRYTHYQAFLPDKNSVPTRSGNYLLKVYLDGDTSKLVFTKQMLVLEQKAAVSASVVQPFTPDKYNTYQKIRFTANVKGLNSFSAAQQVKVVILQNNRWDISQRDIAPTFVRGDVLDYSAESIALFPAGKEWRWLDMRSFSLQGDRVENTIYGKNSTEVFVKTDIDRTGMRYIYFPDLDGMYNIGTFDNINPYWQADYATVHFSYAKPDGTQYTNQDLYIAGFFTGYKIEDKWKMTYNPETLKYECSAYMKQGYYNYTYIAVNKDDPTKKTELEGNAWETENSYTILVYYKAFSDRSDQLIGVSSFNSRSDKPGISF
ncbi:MAG: DUF5103 domain-containing protein [Ferruginibacter sp.]